jgi:hypothetical protein
VGGNSQIVGLGKNKHSLFNTQFNMTPTSIKCDISLALEGDLVHGFYDSLDLNPSDSLSKQYIFIEKYKHVFIFRMLISIPDKLKEESDWICSLKEQKGALVFYINTFPVAAEINLADSEIDDVTLFANDVIALRIRELKKESLDDLYHWPNIETLELFQCNKITKLPSLSCFKKLIHLTINYCKRISDISSLELSQNLLSFRLNNCSAINDISSLSSLRHLEALSLTQCDSIYDLTPISSLISLKNINIDESNLISDISPLLSLEALESVRINRCDELFNLEPISNILTINSLDITFCSEVFDLSALSRLRNLTHLNLNYCTSIVNITPLSSLLNLTNLDLGSCKGITDLKPLSFLDNLKYLNLRGCNSVKNISSLSKLINLSNLDLGGCASIVDLSALSSLRKLEKLDIDSCWSVTTLAPLSQLNNLLSINLSHCSSWDDLSPLSSLTNLLEINMLGCNSVTDLTPISSLINLERINLDSSDKIFDLSPLNLCKSLKMIICRGLPRLRSIEPLRGLAQLSELVTGLHPAATTEILAYSATQRRDFKYILDHGLSWLTDAEGCEIESNFDLEKLASTLCYAFSLLAEHKFAKSLENLLDRHPEFTSGPWKAWFGGTLKESGFDLYRQRVERISAVSMLPGAIGGACATLPYEDNADWSRQWLATLEEARLSDAKDLLPVAPEICLAHARLGEAEALRRWLVRFTDPSDPAALDPVQAALAGFQLTKANLSAAENHIFSIKSPKRRDPVLADLVTALSESDAEDASAKLLLIDAAAIRVEQAKRLAAKPNASETTLHRLAVAMGDSPVDLAELITAIPDPANKTLLETLSNKLQPDRSATLRKIAEGLHNAADRCLVEAAQN